MLATLTVGAMLLGESVYPPFSPILFVPPVADTFLDRSMADRNFGREAVLAAGEGRAILLKFPRLALSAGPGMRVARARLVLTVQTGAPSDAVTLSRLRRPWAEGESRISGPRPDPAAPRPSFEATWRQAISGRGGLNWAEPGAGAALDGSRIAEAKVTVEQVEGRRQLVIEGLESAVQALVDDPAGDFGFRLETPTEVLFHSGEHPVLRPRLDVVWSRAEAVSGPDLVVGPVVRRGSRYVAHVLNAGDQPAPPSRLQWSQDGVDSGELPVPGMAPGAKAEIELPGGLRPEADPREKPVRLRALAAGDQNPGNGSVTVYLGGLPVRIQGAGATNAAELAQAAAEMNEWVIPFSRQGALPAGPRERIRWTTEEEAEAVVATIEEAADKPADQRRLDVLRSLSRALTPLDLTWAAPPGRPELAERGQLGWLPDTRDETFRVRSLPLPPLGWDPLEQQQVAFLPTGLLGRAEAALLHNLVGKRGPERAVPLATLPASALIEVYDSTGAILNRSDAELRAVNAQGQVAETPFWRGTTGREGQFSLRFAGSPLALGEAKWAELRVTARQTSASTWISVLDLWDWIGRQAGATALLESRVMLPGGPINSATNLAVGRLLRDAADRTPAELERIIDGQLGTGLQIPPGAWVEVDLGRDRAIGEVQLAVAGVPPSQVSLDVYKTGSRPSDAVAWFTSPDAAWLWALEPAQNGVRTATVRGSLTQSRYLRVVNRSQSPMDLRELRIFPGQMSN